MNTNVTINSETMVLLSAIKAAVQQVDATEFLALAQGIRSWPTLIERAAQHGLAPLLYRVITSGTHDFVPPDQLTRLRGIWQGNLVRTLELLAKMAALIEGLNAQGIDAIPFKGPALAMLAYGSLDWRETGDIDILVPFDDVPQAAAFLSQKGYSVGVDLTKPRNQTYLTMTYELTYFNRLTNHQVDLHWQLMPPSLPFGAGLKELSQELIEVNLGSKTVRTLAPNELVFYLCLHAVKHHWERMSWLSDVGGLIHRHPDLDWPRIFWRARKLHYERIVLTGLELVRQVTGVTLPLEIKRLVEKDRAVPRLVNETLAQFNQSAPTSLNGLAYFRYFVRFHRGIPDKLRYLGNAFLRPTGSDWFYWRLPRGCTFLYPFLRPFRWMHQKL